MLCDTSPCLYRMRQVMNPVLHLYEPVQFIHDFLMDKLTFAQLPRTVAIHNTCSSIKMELADKFRTGAGYSNSRTCEIGLSLHSGLYYKSILYLVDECTKPV